MCIVDLESSIPVVDTPQQHQYFPRSHHTQSPTHCSCRSPLCLHLQCYLLPVAADQLYMELHVRQRQKFYINFVDFTSLHCTTYLHNPHQHQQSGGSCVRGLVYCNTLVADWNLRYIGHRRERLVHCQHQSGHCYMLSHLLHTNSVVIKLQN